MPMTTKEASFPADYRETQVGQVMRAIYKLRSIAITGLAGMGKSNVARFIVSHPEVCARYLQERANDFAFVLVDCAGLSASDEPQLLNEITIQLQLDGVAHWSQDSHDSRRALKEQLLSVEPNLNLVVVFDYFDEAAVNLDRSFYNFLFHLRNVRPRGNLAYIFVSRRSVGNLYELQELLDDDCVVGPLSYKDALDSLQRDEIRLGCIFNAAQRDALITCAGGHPGFLKNAAELLADGQVDAHIVAEELARQLLGSQKFQRLCAEIWSELTNAEQGILTKVASGVALENIRDDKAAYLKQSGVLVEKEDERAGPSVVIFCPLFQTFVRDQTRPSAIRITAVFPNQARIETATGAENVTLAPKLFALLKILTEAHGQVLPVDDIIARVYGTEAGGVTNAAVSQLVKRLRESLDPCVQRLTKDSAYTCVETVRDVGYRLNE